MKILENAGTYDIRSKTENVIFAIADAARTCYQSHEKSTPETDYKLVQSILNKGHMPMIEFADMTVRFDLICRGFTHEMVRHRLCNFGQESTRFVDESDFMVVLPPHRPDWFKASEEGTHKVTLQLPGDKYETVDVSLDEWFGLNEQMYRGLRSHPSKMKKEDARQVLPIAIKSQIVVKANVREWRHIFKMRCDRYAHWEIRGVMLSLLTEVKQSIPLIFDDFHFFKTEEDQKYARPVMHIRNLINEIKHFKMAGMNTAPIMEFLLQEE